jgi:hypothetical protein
MAITSITDWDGMRHYIVTKLGAPVINVELSEEQIDLAIEDTIRDFWTYNTGRGHYMDYIVFQTSCGVSEYPMSAIRDLKTSAVYDDIESIYDFSVREGLDGLNTLFSPQHILLYDQYVTQGGYPGGPTDNAGIGLTLTNYYTSMMYINMIRESFGKWYTATWIPGKNIMKIVPTPDTCVLGCIVVYRRQLATDLFNDPLIRKLALAKAKIQWGRHLTKYTGNLPDGLNINGDAIMTEGKEEEEKYLQWMRQESHPTDFWIA